jgi:hypothetical protein
LKVSLNMQCTETPTCNISMLRVSASVAPEWATATRGRVQPVRIYNLYNVNSIEKRVLWNVARSIPNGVPYSS